MKMNSPRSILLVKLSAIGDVVHTLPLLEVLRENYPEARIDWLVEQDSSEIIKGHRALDRVIVSRRKSWQKRLFKAGGPSGVLGEIIQFLKELRSEEYDLVIDNQGLLKSGLLIGLSRGRRKIGTTGGREGSHLFLTERPLFVDYNQHALERYLKIAEYLKCRKNSWRGDIPVQNSDKEFIDRFIHDQGVHEARLIAINPVAKWKTKLWDSHKFARLADRIRKELGCKVVFTGSEHDRAVIHDMMRMMDRDSANLAGQTTLKELAYLYSRCRLIISTDTGPMHIAAAMGRPVVALFGPTAPLRTGPYGKNHTVVRDEIDCSPCFKKRCSHMKCMKNVTVDTVFDSVKAFF